MMAAEKEELPACPLVFRAIVAPVVTRLRSNAAPRAQGLPACDPPPRALAPVGGGGTKRNEKFRKLELMAKIQKVLEVPQEGNPYTWGGCSQYF